MLKIFLTRHGQNEDNANGILNGHRDLPLTPRGVEQAHQLAEEVKKTGIMFDAVYVSPLMRARTTADVICERIGLSSPVVLDTLIELNFGEMTGKPVTDIQKLDPSQKLQAEVITWFTGIEGAETYDECLVRAARVLDFVKSNHTDGAVLLVCHGAIGHMIYGAHHGLHWRDALLQFHFGNCEMIQLADTLESDPHIVHIEQYNH